MKVKIKQEVGLPTEARIDKAANLVVLLPETARRGAWPEFPYSGLLKPRYEKRRSGAAPLATDLPNKPGTHTVVAQLAPDISPFALLGLARRLAAAQLAQDPKEVVILCAGLNPPLAERAARAMVAALLAAAHAMPSFKSSNDKALRLASLALCGLEARLDLKREVAEAEGNNLARYLTALPPNQLTPGQYHNWVSALAKQHGWRLRFHDTKALARRRAGAFLAVAQGSGEEDAGIVHLRYTPPKGRRRSGLALVGKGICFDTGGMNLKSARHMHGMHEDMAGSAVALGTLLALSELQVDFPVDCYLALAQNHIGPRAYKQNDVVTAANGTSIEIVHTDAEGRMVLADTLVMASREKPAFIIDYATLTGSCVSALGNGYSGAFGNREPLVREVIAAGQSSGERVWPFPMDESFDELLRSDIADIKQCRIEGEADHILAARFLSRFVEHDTPWLHLDLAAASHKGGLAHIPTDVTGFGVRFTLALILDQNMLSIR